MPTMPSFDTPLDDRGYPFAAVRPARIWRVPNQPTNLPLGPFLLTTKVIRVCTDSDSFAFIYMSGVLNPLIVGRGIYQDFIVTPGSSLNIMLEPSSAAGNICITELG